MRKNDRCWPVRAWSCSLAFVTGGSSQQTNLGVMATELLAIPVLAYALREAHVRGRLTMTRWSTMIFASAAAIPLLQLLPLPQSLWNIPDARRSLLSDLVHAGVTTAGQTWSLTPGATERGFLLLLPASALFISAIALGREAHKRLYWVLTGLCLFSIALGIAQIAAGQQSVLNPFPQWSPEMGGVFANPNHQADAIAVCLVLSVAMAIDERRRVRRLDGSRPRLRALLTLTALFGLSLLIVRSRAGIVIGILGTTAVLIACRAISFNLIQGSWLSRLKLLTVAAGLTLAVYGAVVGLQFDEIDAVSGTRGLLAAQTTMLGLQHAPLGSGVGSFVPVFEQEANRSLLQYEYINHAHNEYVQLWLEGGVLAIVCMIAAVVVLSLALRQLFRLRRDSRLRTEGLAALVGMTVMLVHSFVDYPLRAPALMATFALLGGVVFSAAAQSKLSSPSIERTN